VIACCELLALHAATPRAYAAAIRAAHVPVTVLLISLVAFIYFYLGTGRLALAGTGLALRVLSTPFSFLSGDTLNFRGIQSLRTIEFLGDPVSIPLGTVNPWMLLSHAGILLVLVFLVDATFAVWRRGQRGIPLWVGFSVTLFVLLGLSHAVLLYWGGWEVPVIVTPFFLAVVAVMAYAMFRDLVNAGRLVRETFPGPRSQPPAGSQAFPVSRGPDARATLLACVVRERPARARARVPCL